MSTANTVFSVPLRHLSGVFQGGELARTASPVAGLLRYVGDKQNELLRYFSDGNLPQTNDWPVVLFGPTGTGKTSLAMNLIASVNAASDHCLRIDPNTGCSGIPASSNNPAIFEASDFSRKFNSAIETNSVTEFRERILSSGGILIDGIQVLSGKSAVQKELVYLLDRTPETGLPVVITCSHSPLSSDQLMPQLLSRLASGLCLAVHLPGKEARLEIINELAAIHGLSITADGSDWLADKLNVSVPKINQFFSQLVTRNQDVKSDRLNAGYFNQVFRQAGGPGQENNDRLKKNTQTIIKAVAREMDLKPVDIRSSSRKQTVVLARSIAIHLCRTLLNASYEKIGSQFGNRDHSTVMHACRKIETMIQNAADTSQKPATVKMIEHLNQRLSAQFTELLNT